MLYKISVLVLEHCAFMTSCTYLSCCRYSGRYKSTQSHRPRVTVLNFSGSQVGATMLNNCAGIGVLLRCVPSRQELRMSQLRLWKTL